MHQIYAETNRGGRLITSMTRRQITTRIILILIVLALLLTLGVILYFIIRQLLPKGSSGSGSN